MGGRIDKARGRIREATGVLTGNKDLKRRGKSDQVVAETKINLDKGSAEAKRALDQGASHAEKLVARGRSSGASAIDKGNAALQRVLRRQR